MATIFSSNPIENHANHLRSNNFVERLTTPPIPTKSTGPIFAFIQVIVSLGLLPLLLWPVRWIEYLDAEREVLQDHIDWWRRRADEKDGKKLDKIANRLKRRPLLMVLPMLAMAMNGLLMGTMITRGTTLSQIWDVTFDHIDHTNDHFTYTQWETNSSGFVRLGNPYGEVNNIQTESTANLYKFWLMSLCVAYAIHWYAVRSHATSVQALVDWTNKIAKENNFTRINPRAGCVGLNFLWIILGIGLCCVQAWWAIPMVFAGAMQRQYTRKSSPNIRAALAGQTREVFAVTRTGPDRMCVSTSCQAILPTNANYCPRCGTHA